MYFRRSICRLLATGATLLLGIGSAIAEGLNLEQTICSYSWTCTNQTKPTAPPLEIRFTKDGKATVANLPYTWTKSNLQAIQLRSADNKSTIDLVFDTTFMTFSGRPVGQGAILNGSRKALVAAPQVDGSGPIMNKKEEQQTDFAGMILSPKWMPETTKIRKVFLEDMEFYSDKIVGNDLRGKETPPKNIWADVTWLMPLNDAKKQLPSGIGQGNEVRIVVTDYPQESYSMLQFNGKWNDLGLAFNQLFLVVDSKKQIVAVQLVATSPKGQRWRVPDLVPDGERGNYFDFLTIKYTAAGGRTSYKILKNFPGDPHRRMLKMTAGRGGSQDTHWYIPKPFAARFLDIADAFKTTGGKQ